MNFEIVFVLLALVGMIAALIWDGLRPGMVLLTVVVLFLCAGILTPKEMLEGFSNKGMITVGMLFLVSEGIRQSGALGQLIKKLLPEGKTTVFKAQLRMLPPIAFVSAFLNNTPVVVMRFIGWFEHIEELLDALYRRVAPVLLFAVRLGERFDVE